MVIWTSTHSFVVAAGACVLVAAVLSQFVAEKRVWLLPILGILAIDSSTLVLVARDPGCQSWQWTSQTMCLVVVVTWRYFSALIAYCCSEDARRRTRVVHAVAHVGLSVWGWLTTLVFSVSCPSKVEPMCKS